MGRPTINDVATRRGRVQGRRLLRPQRPARLSPDTRKRILETAESLGWAPSPRARALSVSKALAVGLVIARPPEILRADAFFPSFIAGLETVLSPRGHALLLQVAEHDDHAAYRRLVQEGRVDGVFVTDLAVDDERPALLEELGLPAIIIGPHLGEQPGRGSPRSASTTRPASAPPSSTSSGSATATSPTSPARCTWCTAGRAASPGPRRSTDAGLPEGTCVEADFSAESGASAMHTLLDLADRPTAVVFANDLMAMAGLSLALSRGISVPGDLSVTGFDDVEISAHLQPSLTSVQHRRRGLGPRGRHPAPPAHRPGGADSCRPAGRTTRRAFVDRPRPLG